MNKTCEQSWQVDAVRDGRLDAATRQAFVQHQQSCVSCATEQLVLERIRKELAEIGAHTDEMAVRRQRLRNEELARQTTRSTRLRAATHGSSWMLAVCVVLAAAALLSFVRV